MVLETVLASLFAGRPGALISLKPGAGEFFNRLFGLNRFDRVRDSRNIVMSNDQDVIPDLLCRAVNCVLRGEPRAARSLIASIDQSALVADRKSALRRRRSKLASAFLEDRPRRNREDSNGWAARGQPRMTVPRSAMLAIFQRDHFVCRYQHCRRRTVYVPVLRALSALFPDLIPYQKNWRPPEDHILYWTYGASLEHLISFPHGGTSDRSNLITACYHCNEIKNMLWADDLGWVVSDVCVDDWDGLSCSHPGLSEFVAAAGRPGLHGASRHPLNR